MLLWKHRFSTLAPHRCVEKHNSKYRTDLLLRAHLRRCVASPRGRVRAFASSAPREQAFYLAVEQVTSEQSAVA
jgi:hypothetical protein